MEKEIIKDQEGNPVSVVLDYREWVLIETYLNHQNINFNVLQNPLDWYVLTESMNSILNELIAYAGRERFLELRKKNPKLKRIENLKEFSEEIRKINRNSDNFRDVGRMRNIIDTYAPLLEEINNGKQVY
ncbi:hypothetical protein [Chryseobacterium sp. EZn1]|uniref:hypothetical protein n=1 Tax=Chryseobacterium cupriresistens TaxID=3366770 RepID=UPI0039850268